MQPRDMTKKQFHAALERNGMKREAFGYINVGGGLCVHAANAGMRRRDQLAYLLAQRDRHQAKVDNHATA